MTARRRFHGREFALFNRDWSQFVLACKCRAQRWRKQSPKQIHGYQRHDRRQESQVSAVLRRKHEGGHNRRHAYRAGADGNEKERAEHLARKACVGNWR
jgi:hypothetical protein